MAKPFRGLGRSRKHGGTSNREQKEADAINEQLLLVDLALAQIELGGNDDEVIGKTRLPWGDIRKELQTTLEKIVAPEAQEMAMREIASRLIEKKQPDLALMLAGSLSGEDAFGRRPPVYSQKIALQFSSDQKPDAEMPPANAKEDYKNAPVRSGYAEGHARKGDFDAAFMSMVDISRARRRINWKRASAWRRLPWRRAKEKATEAFKARLRRQSVGNPGRRSSSRPTFPIGRAFNL